MGTDNSQMPGSFGELLARIWDAPTVRLMTAAIAIAAVVTIGALALPF